MSSIDIEMGGTKSNLFEVTSSSGGHLPKPQVRIKNLVNDEILYMVGVEYGNESSGVCWGPVSTATSMQRLIHAPHCLCENDDRTIPNAVAAVRYQEFGKEFVELKFAKDAVNASEHGGRDFLAFYKVTKLDYLGLYDDGQDEIAAGMYKTRHEQQKKALEVILENTKFPCYYVSYDDKTGEQKRMPSTNHVVRIWDPLLGKMQARRITTPADIEREFLRFILQSAVVHFAKEQKIPHAKAQEIFEKNVEIAFSVPAGCSNFKQHALCEQLRDASYPEKTLMLSESKGLGLYHLSRKLLFGWDPRSTPRPPPKVTMMCNIGPTTFDFSTLFTYTSEVGATYIGELGFAESSLDGGEKLNQTFIEYLDDKMKSSPNIWGQGGIEDLAPDFEGDVNDLKSVLIEEFEDEIGHHFIRGLGKDLYPQLKDAKLNLIRTDEFHTEDDTCISFSASALTEIFDTWLKPIKEILKRQHAAFVKCYGTRISLEIGLVGLMGMTMYVEEAIRDLFRSANVPVHCFEFPRPWTIANANYISLQYRKGAPILDTDSGYGVVAQSNHMDWLTGSNDHPTEIASDTHVFKGLWNNYGWPILHGRIAPIPRQLEHTTDHADTYSLRQGYKEDYNPLAGEVRRLRQENADLQAKIAELEHSQSHVPGPVPRASPETQLAFRSKPNPNTANPTGKRQGLRSQTSSLTHLAIRTKAAESAS